VPQLAGWYTRIIFEQLRGNQRMPEDLAPEFPRERPIGSNNWRIMIFQFIENLYI
jgi:hypothetical protein